MFRKGISIAATIATLIAASPAAADEPITLRFAIPGASPTSSTYTGVFQPWMAQVEADAAGNLKLQEFFTIANFGNVYDRVVNGVADLGYMVLGSMGGKFPGSSVVELPSDIAYGREGAGAFWKLYQDGTVTAEYREVRPLALFVFPQNVLSSPKAVATLADLKGLRVATLSKGAGDIVERLGGAPMSTNPAGIYEILQRRTADAAIIGWLGLTSLKLAEVTNYHVALGLDSGGGALVMNKDVYDKLPVKAKQAIDKNSGSAASQALGGSFDRVYANAENIVRNLPGHFIVSVTQADKERYARDIAGPLTAEWVQKTPNGAAILAAYRAEAGKLRQAR